MKKLNKALYLFIGFIFFACEDAMNVYNTQDDRLNFTFQGVHYDSVSRMTFVYEPEEVTSDTVFLKLRTMGFIRDYDRRIKLEQIPSAGMQAVSGVHFISIDDPSFADDYVVKAGRDTVIVPIVLLRDKSLKKQEYTLTLKIVENEYFKIGQLRDAEKTIVMADVLSKPSKWTTSIDRYYFGPWGKVKHQFMIDVSGEKIDDDYFTLFNADYGYMISTVAFFKEELIRVNEELAANGKGPLREEPKEGQIEGDLVKIEGVK